jgi:hypothetical protein
VAICREKAQNAQRSQPEPKRIEPRMARISRIKNSQVGTARRPAGPWTPRRGVPALIHEFRGKILAESDFHAQEGNLSRETARQTQNEKSKRWSQKDVYDSIFLTERKP